MEKQWQFIDDDGQMKDGGVEIEDETWRQLQGGMDEDRRQRLMDHYDRIAKWRYHKRIKLEVEKDVN